MPPKRKGRGELELAEAHIATLVAQAPVPAAPLPAPRTKAKPKARDNAPRFDMRTPLHQLTGVDLPALGRFGCRGVPFAAWLEQIASKAVADRWQRAAREREAPPPAPSDDGSLTAVDRRTMLADLVGQLPDDQQRVVLDRFVEDKSMRDAFDNQWHLVAPAT